MAALPVLWSEGSPATAAVIISSGARYLQLQERLKVVLWLGAITFSLVFAWKMAEFMPSELVLAFWTTAEFIALVGFYRLFIYGVPNTNGAGDIMKAVLCALATALNIIFTWRMMKIFSPTLAVFVYAKTVFIAIWGFYAVFLSTRRRQFFHAKLTA